MLNSNSDTYGDFPSAHQLHELLAGLEDLNEQISRALSRCKSLHNDSPSDAASSVSSNVNSQGIPPLTVIEEARRGLRSLDAQLETLEKNVHQLEGGLKSTEVLNGAPCNTKEQSKDQWPWPLEKAEYQRYGRQLIMPEIGLQGQLRLQKSSVLIVGVGGLGCPAAMYLAGAGVGSLGLMDGDSVELSNLHRQIAHSTETLGWQKVDSAIHSLKAINPLVKYKAHTTHLTPQNALAVLAQYDVILDCTDHPTSRYLISDAAVLLRKPLVSASALRVDGQLTVLNYPPRPPGDSKGGPCYRCIFPKPPPAESVISCGEGGILGPVVGVMGVLQALEAVKVITARPQPDWESGVSEFPSASLLIFSALSDTPFRNMRLRGRRAGCVACSAETTITQESLTLGSMDYVQFCGVAQPINVLGDGERLTAAAYAAEKNSSAAKDSRNDTVLLDVRDKTQFELCSFPGSINIPYTEIESWKSADDGASLRQLILGKHVRVLCRVGNDSQLAVQKLKQLGIWDGEQNRGQTLADVRGGLKAWKRDVDDNWPDY